MKIKLTGFWEDEHKLFNTFKRFNFGSPVWKNIEIVNTNYYDVLVILTQPHFNFGEYDSRKAITFLTEPPTTTINRTHDTSAIMSMYLPLPFWGCFSYSDWRLLKKPYNKKTELLSAVVSELNYLEGHKARRQLVYFLDRRVDEGFVIWGKQYGDGFLKSLRNYKGELSNKYQALWKYMYHFACENSFVENYFTEKIVDPILAECLCFYDGCSNMEEYIDKRAFIRVNVFEPLTAIEQMIKEIQEGGWQKRIRYIKQQKIRLMHDLNPLNIIWASVNGKDTANYFKL